MEKKKYNLKTAVRKTAKKSVRHHRKGMSAVALLLVLAIVACAGILYWQRPDLFAQGVAWLQGLNGGGETLQNSDGELKIHFIDVGQGDCILIMFPDGKTMMIDSGNCNNSSDYENDMLDYVGGCVTDGQIDYLMLTHSDSDHCYFLDEILAAYDVDEIFMPDILSTLADQSIPSAKLDMFTDEDTIGTQCYANFFNAALSEPEAQIVLNIGTVKIETATYRLTFYCPTQQFWDDNDLSSAEEKNAVSPIGILEYNGFKVVLTGDANEITEPLVMDRIGAPIDCDVLKVGHHGSETSSTPVFLDFIDCEYAVISANSDGNTFGHPTQATLDRLSERNMHIYRTDQDGTIVLSIKDSIQFSTQNP